MKIVYLTWGETPRSYGVFGSQVIGQFVATKKLMPEAEFGFISAIPIIHSGMVREKLNYRSELSLVRKHLEDISFSRIPIYASQNFVNSSKNSFPFMHFGTHRHLANIFSKEQPNIVHCRGYHSTYAALKVRHKFNLNYKVIFDARGLWPEEVALKNAYNNKDINYLFLKKIEQWNLDNSDIIVSVSDPMSIHYRKLTNTSVDTIYLSSSTENFYRPVNNDKKKPITLIYVGALSKGTWHKPNILADLYSKFRAIWDSSRLIIVSTSNHESIRSEFKQFPKDEITLTSTKTQKELASLLVEADFSCLPYVIPTTEIEKVISETMLAVKTVEYLSAGLPLLCNKYCGGAGSLIEQNGLGINYDPQTHHEINLNNLQDLMTDEVSREIRSFSQKNFNYKINGKKYKNIYLNLCNA